MVRLIKNKNGFTTLSINALLLLITFLTLICTATSTSFAQAEVKADQEKSVTLGPIFEVGKVSVYEHHAVIKSSQEQLDKDKKSQGLWPSEADTTLVMRVVVDSINDNGVATVVMTYDKVVMTGDSFFSGKFSFNSEEEPAADADLSVVRTLQALKDVKVVAQVQPDGTVLHVTGTEDIVSRMENVNTLAGRSNEFRPESIQQMIQSFWRIGEEYSTRTLNEAWIEQQETLIEGLGTLFFISNYNVSDINDDTAKVDFNLEMMLLLDEANTLENNPPKENATEGNNDDDGTKPGKIDDGGKDKLDQGQGQDPDQDKDENKKQEEGDEADQAMEPQYIPIKSSNLEIGDNPGFFLWDVKRGELIERSTKLKFTLTTEQAGLFQLELTTIQRNDVYSTLKRLATE